MLTDERAVPAPRTPISPTAEAVTAQPKTISRSDHSGRSRLLGWTALTVLFVGFELDQLRALLSYGRLATNEDQTLLWFAGRELLRFHLHQPNFYGQNYNTVFEALPGQLFHLLGVWLQLSVLGTNLGHPARLFGFYEPQLWQHPAVVIAAIAILLILAVAVSFTVRRSAPAAAALTFLVVLLVILSARDTLNAHPDLYRSGSRFLLPMPIGLWVVLFFTLAAIRDHRRVTAVDAGTHPVLVVVNSTALLAECAEVKRVYRATRAELLVTYQRNVACGCAAQDDLNTLDTDYERRGWLLRAAATRPVRRILIQGWTCRTLAARTGACRAERPGIVLLTTPLQPPSISLARTAAALRIP